MRHLTLFILLLLSLHAQEASESNTTTSLRPFVDEKDGAFDVSNFLASKYGFLATPIIITGPTFGSGLGLNLMFLHGTLSGKKSATGKYIPPNISGVAAAATENGTKFGAAYHLGFYKEGDLRTTTFLGRPNANMDFYPDSFPEGKHVTMNLEGYAFYQEIKHRLADSDWFAGGNYLYFDVNSKPKEIPSLLPPALFEKNFKNAALSAALEYDTRDTIFTTTSGTYFKGVLARYDENLGGDFDYTNYRAKVFHFMPINETLHIDLRLEGEHVNGSAPYFAYPSIQIRGIATSRYQGQSILVSEVQANWEFIPRWSLVGFLGTGKAFGQDALSSGKTSLSSAPYRTAGGSGFRYTIARKFKIKAGLDFAVGPEEKAVYITVGSAWNAFF